jgi:voltage-gated potassium channel
MFKGFIVPVCLFVALLCVGGVFYHNVEGWKYVDSVYFSAITMTTIGYGDFSPQTDTGKIFTIFFALSSIGIASYFFTMIGRYFFMKQRRDILKSEGRLVSSRGIRKIR